MTRGPYAAVLSAAAVCAAVLTTPAFAQAPTSLFPNRPAPSAQPSDGPVLPSNMLGVEDLQAVGGDSFGLRDGADGLGADLWRGARRGQIIELMSLMPGATPSATMNALAQRLLLTTAAVPNASPNANDAKADSYLAIRLNRLEALGDAAVTADLAQSAPGRSQDEAVVRAMTDAAFLTGAHEAACSEVRSAVGASGDVAWRKALAFCQAIGNERAQANLTAATLREQSPQAAKNDAAFFALLAGLGGDRNAKPATLPAPTPLHIAMLRAAKLAAPADAFETDDMAVLAALAQLPEGPLDARLAAGERAEAAGALPTSVLIKLYEELRFTQAQLANALTGSESESGPRARALLYAAQARQGAAAGRAVLIQRALALSQDAGLFPTTARVYGDALAGIPPTSDLAWFAASATRALFAAGRIREGRAWLGALGGGLGGGVGGTATNAQEIPPAVALLPYALITAEPRSVPVWDADLWQRWKAAQGPLMPTRASLFLTLLEGLGRPAPEEAWDGLARAQTDRADHLPAPSVLRTLEVSAATDRKGLAVLAALATFGPDGPAGTHPLVLGMALAGLRNIGLGAEARALAVDAAIGAGL
jgi:hypothetical protein